MSLVVYLLLTLLKGELEIFKEI